MLIKEKREANYVWTPIREKGMVLLPAEFDRRLAGDPKFESLIAGCSSLSISLIEGGISSDGSEVTIPTYIPSRGSSGGKRPRVGLYPHPEILVGVVGKEADQNYGYPTMADWIEENRTFGTVWAIDELLIERDLPDRLPGFEPSWDLGVAHSLYEVKEEIERRELSSLGAIVGLLSTPALREEFPLNYCLDILSRWAQYVGSTEAVAEFLAESRDRRGVQVIYQDRAAVAGFIGEHEHEWIKDEQMIHVFSGIPSQLVMTLIPLGSYEQGKMGLLDRP